MPGTPPPLAHVFTGQHTQTPTPALVAPYLSWIYAKSDQLGAMQRVGIQTVYYTNPIQPICSALSGATCVTGDYGYNDLNTGGAYNDVAAKDCSGNLVRGTYTSGGRALPVLFLDPTKPRASAYLQNVMEQARAYLTYANGFPWAATELFVDNFSASLYAPSATPCGYNASTWLAADTAALGATTDGPYQVNSLGGSTFDAPTMQAKLSTLAPANVASGDFEQCYGGNSPQNIVAQVGATFEWRTPEYMEINTIAAGKTFWCYVRLAGDGSAYVAWRLYTYASFLLSYDPHHAVIEESLSGGASGLNVFPEWLLVPMNPSVTASDVSGYLQPSGVYWRTFAACYQSAAPVGPCAVAVNPSRTATVALPAGYTRALALSGGGVSDGGTATIMAPAPTSLAPASAAIVFP